MKLMTVYFTIVILLPLNDELLPHVFILFVMWSQHYHVESFEKKESFSGRPFLSLKIWNIEKTNSKK